MTITDAEIVANLRRNVIPDSLYEVRANGYQTPGGRWRRHRYLCEKGGGLTRAKIYPDGSGYVGSTSLDFRFRPMAK